MSTNSNTAAPQSSAARIIFGMLAAAPKRWWTAFIVWRAQQAAITHLHAMSDRELRDIGISRAQIEPAVLGERARDRALGRYL